MQYIELINILNYLLPATEKDCKIKIISYLHYNLEREKIIIDLANALFNKMINSAMISKIDRLNRFNYLILNRIVEK
jgi:hypothetical protein